MALTLLSRQSVRSSPARFASPHLQLSKTASTNTNTSKSIHNFYRRCFGAASSSKKNDTDDNDTYTKSSPACHMTHMPAATLTTTTDLAAKGIGQVLFLNDRRAGALIFGSLAVGDPYLAFLAGTGCLAANATASTVSLEEQALRNGLWGYNGCLVGCATAVFICPMAADMNTASATAIIPTLVTAGIWTATGAAASTIISASLPGALGKVPQFTLAFNLVTLSVLLRTQPLAQVTGTAVTSSVSTDMVAAAATTAVTSSTDIVTMGELLTAPLHSLSQIFVVESVWTGAGVMIAIASYSPRLAAHALAGATVGSLTGVATGAPLADIAAGLWGYNSALTSMTVGVFFVSDNDNGNNTPMDTDKNTANTTATTDTNNNRRAAAVTALSMVFGAMQTVFAAGAGAPCLTLPFCWTARGCYLLANVVPGLQLAANPHSPEKNQLL
jgi:urea transporter